MLPGTLIDQHFITRNRDGRMRQVLHSHPGLVGLGIDEETAIVVRNGQFTVAGNSRVVVYFSHDGVVSIAHTLAPGARLDLATLKTVAAGAAQPIDVAAFGL